MQSLQKNTVKSAISGALAGTANGLFGAGGGMILVPLLTRLCKLEDRKAFTTAISIILPLCLVSLLVYTLHGAVDYLGALPYLLGGFFGGLLGGRIYQKIPTILLHRLLGALILYGGLRSLL